MKKTWWLLSLIAILMACEVKPQEIDYGHDACHFCQMTIVDTQHAAELVTTKGKSFKYDAIECMLNDLQHWDEAPVKLYLVADYGQPKLLIDATKAHYLISESIPSPMGAFLSAFESQPMRNQTLSTEGGEAYDWQSLQENFDLKTQ